LDRLLIRTKENKENMQLMLTEGVKASLNSRKTLPT
jgi:hypothetical protein